MPYRSNKGSSASLDDVASAVKVVEVSPEDGNRVNEALGGVFAGVTLTCCEAVSESPSVSRTSRVMV